MECEYPHNRVPHAVVNVSFKTGLATGAALLALFGGAQVAQAGIGDGVGDPIGAVENALPNPEETDLGAVVEEATEAVDEATGSVDAEAAVSDAKGAVDEAVADPKGTAERVVEQAKNTVENPTGTITDIAEKTPAGKVVKGVTKSLDPVVSKAGQAPVVSKAGQAIGSPKGQAGAPAAFAGRSEAARPGSKRPAPALTSNAPASPQAFSAAAPGATLTLGQPGSITSSATALITRTGATSAQAGWTPLAQVPASAKPLKVSSAAPAAPFAPPAPGDQPATAASVAGAAGAALLAALFGALFFLAPRTGRLARPGPNLVRAEPCLSLPERPG
jgi:hypothetical protein